MILALNSFSHSLLSDISESVDDSGSQDLLSSTSPPCSTLTGTLQSSKFLSHGSGLGISGLMNKDGSAPFDGLGIVFIKSSPWRHDDFSGSEVLQLSDGIDHPDSIPGLDSSTYDDSSEFEDLDHPSSLVDDTGISDVFLQETLLTFTQDPFHRFCRSNVVSPSSIPDCDNNPWSQLGHGASGSSSMFELLANTTTNDSSRLLNCRSRRIPNLSRNFSSATISSELKRSSTWRNRSSSWPSSTAEGAISATPLPRCKWRL